MVFITSGEEFPDALSDMEDEIPVSTDDLYDMEYEFPVSTAPLLQVCDPLSIDELTAVLFDTSNDCANVVPVQPCVVEMADVPMADVPMADVPMADVPVADVPMADVPVEASAVEAAVVEVADVPVEPPVVEAPAVEVADVPVEPPAVEAPAVEVVDVPVEPPAVEAPAVEVVDVLVEPPAVEAPAVEVAEVPVQTLVADMKCVPETAVVSRPNQDAMVPVGVITTIMDKLQETQMKQQEEHMQMFGTCMEKLLFNCFTKQVNSILSCFDRLTLFLLVCVYHDVIRKSVSTVWRRGSKAS
jgi:hypothetical protein